MPPIPAYTKTWVQALTTGTPGIRIPFTSVLSTSQQCAFTLKDFLINSSTATTKYTMKCSASGGVGPTNLSDNTDRITNAAAWTPRATVAAASQAWFMLQDAFGAQVLVAFQGGSDDVWRISFSPGGLFVLAGTTTHQPTATDEQVVLATTTIVGSTASADRILHIWARDDAKGFRVAIFRSNAVVAPIFCIEEFNSAPVTGISGVTVSPALHGGVVNVPSGSDIGSNLNGAFVVNSLGSVVRAVISSVGFSCQCEYAGLARAGVSLGATSTVSHLQGAVWVPYPLILFSGLTNAIGPLGQVYDHYQVQPTGVAVGNGFGNSYQWVHVGRCLIWPNPSNVQPTIN
jgi:hypothetical protein